jgi:hypothetical protein
MEVRIFPDDLDGARRMHSSSMGWASMKRRKLPHPPCPATERQRISDPGEHVTNGRREPLAAAGRRDAPVIESACDGPQ